MRARRLGSAAHLRVRLGIGLRLLSGNTTPDRALEEGCESQAQGGHFEEAMQLAIRSLRTRVQLRSKGHQDVIESYIQVARLFENMENLTDAITNFEKALVSLKKLKGDEASAHKVQVLTKRVLHLGVRNQTLSMRTMLQTKMLSIPPWRLAVKPLRSSWPTSSSCCTSPPQALI